jgi:hypothetical protein
MTFLENFDRSKEDKILVDLMKHMCKLSQVLWIYQDQLLINVSLL